MISAVVDPQITRVPAADMILPAKDASLARFDGGPLMIDSCSASRHCNIATVVSSTWTPSVSLDDI
jgi:hypothetical protein